MKIIYDAINDRLIIHRWYVLTKEERKSVQAEMSEYFKLVKRFNEKLKSIDFVHGDKSMQGSVVTNRRFFAIYDGYPDEIAVFPTAKSRDEWVRDGETGEVKRIALSINHVQAILGSCSDYMINEILNKYLCDPSENFFGGVACILRKKLIRTDNKPPALPQHYLLKEKQKWQSLRRKPHDHLHRNPFPHDSSDGGRVGKPGKTHGRKSRYGGIYRGQVRGDVS